METSRDDVSIAIRSAFLKKGTQQRFSLFVLIILSIIFIFVETIENKPLNYLRSIIKAFQRRFRQELISGQIDKECLIISNNLAKKYY